MKEEALLTGSLLDYVNFTELLASTTHVQDEDAPAIAKVQRVLRRVIRETDDCQVVRKYKVGGLGYISYDFSFQASFWSFPKISEEASFQRRSGAVGDARVGGGARGARTLGATVTSSPGPGAPTAGRCSGAPSPTSAATPAHAPAAWILEVSRRRICGRKRKSRQQEGGRMSSPTKVTTNGHLIKFI